MANYQDFFRTSLQRLLVLTAGLCLLLHLSGCSEEGFADLQKYMSDVKARPRGTIESLPEIKPVEPFVFKPEGLRDPFKAIGDSEAAEEALVSIGNGIRPDTSRRKEELEAFPLDSLRMVGTVTMKSNLWGLVKASDKTIYRVQVGNYMGKNYGKIIRILTDKIELMEIVPDKPGTWREQQTSLALTE